jgi:hypothetical protein
VTDTFDGENMDAVLNGFIPEGGAGFFINVTVTDDPNITFSEGGVVLERAPDVFQFDPVFIPFLVELPRAEPPTPSAPEPVEMATITPDVNPYLQLNTTEDLPVPPDAPASADVRIIIVEKIGPDGDVEVDRNDRKMTRDYVDRAAEEILEDPFKLFEKLKSGRFRVWLKDGLHAEPNLIWDVILRDGRPQAGGEGTLRLPTEAPGETADEVPGPGGDASTPETSQPGADDAASESATSPAAAGSAPPAASEVAPRLQAAPAQADPESNAEAQRDARPGAAAAGVLFLPAALRSFAGNGWRTARRVGSALASLVRSA